MTTIFHPNHSHFAVHKAFVEGSFANPDEPPIVQFFCTLASREWLVDPKPTWVNGAQYRIKPRTIARTVTYAEPLREAPARGIEIWFVCSWFESAEGETWRHSPMHLRLLKNGMVFATEDDAQSCYDALFGEQK